MHHRQHYSLYAGEVLKLRRDVTGNLQVLQSDLQHLTYCAHIMSSSSKKYAGKLSSKLAALQDTSSKESLQTLARWISFHRKHSSSFMKVLTGESFRNDKKTLSVISELLLLDHEKSDRWERLSDLRVSMGEHLVQAIEDIVPNDADKLNVLIVEWDKENVFGGPTLIHQLRHKLTSAPKKSPPLSNNDKISTEETETTTQKPEVSTVVDETDSDKSENVIKEKKTSKADANDRKPITELSPESETQSIASTSPSLITNTAAAFKAVDFPLQDYDFESKGIPARKVESREFLEPCRALATLQIARDLRNDNAIQLSSLLQGMPQDVREFTANAVEMGDYIITEEMTRDFCQRVAGPLLDTDMTEALQNVRTLRDIVRQQSAARQQLLELLVASRCDFGADEAAEAFYNVNTDDMKRRSDILADALELEGLDIVNEVKAKGNSEKSLKDQIEEELPALTWYKRKADSLSVSSSTKRQRIEASPTQN